MVRLSVGDARPVLQILVLHLMADRRVPENSFDLRLEATGISPDRAPIVLRIIRSLAGGEPVTPSQAGIRDAAAWEELKRLGAEVDADDRIVGIGGLSIRPTKYQFVAGGNTLYTWCALDTLFLPHLLGIPADVTSTCPVTGDPIRLRVSPSRIESVLPEATVVSLVRAETQGQDDDRSQLFGPQGSFCCRVHFFASREAAESWIVGQEGAVIVSPQEAFRIGQETCSLPLLGGGSLNFQGDTMNVILKSVLTCPECGHSQEEEMPEDACVRFYDCPGCQAVIGPHAGDCCVFCSYGSVPCPPIQAGDGCDCP